MTDWIRIEEAVIQIAANHLASNGLILFLTPIEKDSTVKITQINSLTDKFGDKGFVHKLIDISKTPYDEMKDIYKNEKYSSPNFELGDGQRNPRSLLQMRKRFVEDGDRLGVNEVFDLDKPKCRPYYSFSCQVDLIYKPESADDTK